MNIKRILAAIFAVSIIGAGVPVISATAPETSITANAADFEYGDLTYRKYTNYIVITGCDKSTTHVIIPKEIEGLPVTRIEWGAFENCSRLLEVTIPYSVTEIGWNAFKDCILLDDVEIPSSVKTIESRAFSGCSSLTSITIPYSVTSIGSYAFEGCTDLKSATLPYAIKEINDNTFCNCSSLESITIPDSVTSINSNAFSGCTSLTSIVLSDNVTLLGYKAFEGCTNLESVTIDGSITFDGRVFENCTSLESVVINGSIEALIYNTFSNCTKLSKLTVGSEIKYFNDTSNDFYKIPWFVNTKKENPLVILGKYLFDGTTCSGNVIIPESVKRIRNSAFYKCTDITSVTVPSTALEIGSNSFYGCSNLKSITFLNSETAIADYANTISSTAVIKGYKGSTAQAYAKKYNRTFEVIEFVPSMGDVTGDNQITGSDATLVLMAYTKIASSEDSGLTEAQKKTADVDGDGQITGSDATLILRYYTMISSLPSGSSTPSLEDWLKTQ